MMEEAGYRFRVWETHVDESVPPGVAPSEAAVALAVEKARAVDAPGAVILAADTLLDLDDEILGKPADDAHARRILARLAGRTHWVVTGVCVRRAESLWTGLEQTRITFRPLTPDDIDTYVATGEPRGKAGAYAIQGAHGRALVERVEGPVDNVIGLPMGVVRRLLREAGYAPA